MIVCLGWGSLIWNPGALGVKGQWEPNGPNAPVEYLRQSSDGRLTLVIDKESQKTVVLWVRMRATNLEAAKENLCMREGTKRKYIGSWRKGDPVPEEIPDLSHWAASIKADAIILTALQAKFNGDNFQKPSYQEALNYLKGLPQETRSKAEDYVRKTPRQIRTPFRELFEKDLGWVPENAT